MFYRLFLFLIAVALFVQSAGAQNPLLFPQREKDKYGYIDAAGVLKLKYVFEEANPFSEEKAFVKNGKWGGYVRINGSWAIYDTTLISGDPMKQAVAIARKKQGSGVYDSSGKTIIPFEYDYIRRLDEVRILLATKKATLANGSQTKVIHLYTFKGLKVPIDFEDDLTQPNCAAVGMKQNGKYWVYGKDGKVLLDYQVDDLFAGPYGARLKLNNLHGAVNRNGDLVLPIRYKTIWISDWQNYASFETVNRDTSAYMNLDNGRVAFTYNAILENPASNDAIIISYLNNVHNVYDLTGKRISQLVTYQDTSRSNQNNYIQHFFQLHYSEGLVSIQHADKKWYAYNKQGKLAFPNGFEAAFEFKNGVAIVRTNGYSFEYGAIDKTGKIIIPLIYKSIYYTSEPNILKVYKDNKAGLIKTDGSFFFPMQSVNFADQGNGFFFVTGDYSLNYIKYGYANSRTGFVYFSTTPGE